MSKKGFTLIELLITVSILAIMSAIGLVLYSSVMKQGRDSKRQSDLRSTQSALEQYYSDQGFYPAGNLPFGSQLDNCDGNPASPCSGTKIYINNIPNDSDASTPYVYVALRNGAADCTNADTLTQCNSYCLYAKLENSSPGIGNCAVNGSYNFAVTPP